MNNNTCMYTAQGEMKCCPSNDLNCFYDFSLPSKPKPSVFDETKASSFKSNYLNQITEGFTNKSPVWEKESPVEYTEPVGIMPGFLSTCQSVN